MVGNKFIWRNIQRRHNQNNVSIQRKTEEAKVDFATRKMLKNVYAHLITRIANCQFHALMKYIKWHNFPLLIIFAGKGSLTSHLWNQFQEGGKDPPTGGLLDHIESCCREYFMLNEGVQSNKVLERHKSYSDLKDIRCPDTIL